MRPPCIPLAYVLKKQRLFPLTSSLIPLPSYFFPLPSSIFPLLVFAKTWA